METEGSETRRDRISGFKNSGKKTTDERSGGHRKPAHLVKETGNSGRRTDMTNLERKKFETSKSKGNNCVKKSDGPRTKTGGRVKKERSGRIGVLRGKPG